jgi:hypothetical protein
MSSFIGVRNGTIIISGDDVDRICEQAREFSRTHMGAEVVVYQPIKIFSSKPSPVTYTDSEEELVPLDDVKTRIAKPGRTLLLGKQ